MAATAVSVCRTGAARALGRAAALSGKTGAARSPHFFSHRKGVTVMAKRPFSPQAQSRPAARKSPRQRRAERDYAQLYLAMRLLKNWGAPAAAVRASLALTEPQDATDWARGEARLSFATAERIAVVFALYRLLNPCGASLRPLPALRRAGRPALAAQKVLANGRFSDLLGLWRQIVRDEEKRAHQTARQCSGR